MTMHIRIERLVVEGLPLTPDQGPFLQAAVEAELARLLAASDLPPGLLAGGATPVIRAGAVELAPEHGPARLGAQIARSVYGSFGG